MMLFFILDKHHAFVGKNNGFLFFIAQSMRDSVGQYINFIYQWGIHTKQGRKCFFFLAKTLKNKLT